MALHLAQISYEHREIELRNKPHAMLAISPKGSVPVLVQADGNVLEESLDIMRWALPDAAFENVRITANDGPFKFHLDRYKYASRYDETLSRGATDPVHRDKAFRILLDLEMLLAKQSCLSGDQLGATDVAIFPFIRQFAAVEPDWWSSMDALERTRHWLSNCVETPLFKAIMVKHPIWRAPP